jgi:hypothetical protein
MRAVCVVLLSLLALASAVDEGNRENTKNCFITGEPAVKVRVLTLSFCRFGGSVLLCLAPGPYPRLCGRSLLLRGPASPSGGSRDLSPSR